MRTKAVHEPVAVAASQGAAWTGGGQTSRQALQIVPHDEVSSLVGPMPLTALIPLFRPAVGEVLA